MNCGRRGFLWNSLRAGGNIGTTVSVFDTTVENFVGEERAVSFREGEKYIERGALRTIKNE